MRALLLLLSTTVACAPAASQPVDPGVVTIVDSVIGSVRHPEMRWPDLSDVAPTMKDLYGAEPDQLLWFSGTTPDPSLAGIVEGLGLADEHGLDRADYDADRLLAQWKTLAAGTATPAQRALFDLALTACVSRLLSAVHVGRVDPATLDWGYDLEAKRLDRGAVLRELKQLGDLGKALALREPPFSHYARAKSVLARYKSAAGQEPPAVPALPAGRKKLEPGQPWEGLAAVAARLHAFGDLPDAAVPTSYDAPLVDAVKSFQRRHGMEPDGVLGAGTIASLNVTLTHRVRQIQLAMERMRWLPQLSEHANLFVNVPLFRLWATDPKAADEPLRMNVVVGKSLQHKTPIFIDRLEYVVFRPYWNPPPSIITSEIVPRAQRDAGYFARENLEIVATGDDDAAALPVNPENLERVVSGRLFVRQKPGPKNSLGLAKFIFPNAENVYMHGTPAQTLFSRARRDFSHGCIRLEDPTALAEWVLRDQPEWDRKRIEAAMQGERPTRVNLKEPLTVVLFYDTVHVNSQGVLFFVEDIYGHDRQLDEALVVGYPYPARAAKAAAASPVG